MLAVVVAGACAAFLGVTSPASAAATEGVRAAPVGVRGAATEGVRAAAPGLFIGAGAKADDGASVVTETMVDLRTVDLTINSPAMGGNVMTRLLLPAGWASQPTATWPVLWLLHGAGELQDYRSWTFYTDVEAFTADKNVLVVLPSDGPAGFYTDWQFSGRADPRQWQTFHMVELYQILQRSYRAGPNQAIAGLSLGGYGALAYAFQYPGRFKAAASYSGLVDTLWPGAPILIQAMVARTNQRPIQMWGDSILNYFGWAARDPAKNFQRLRGTSLYLSCGNGKTQAGDGPLDAVLLEEAAAPANQALASNLLKAGIPVTTNLGNDGVHAWPYWQANFKESWPLLAAALGV